MAWGRLDDGMAFHRKIIKAGNAAVGAWARLIAWSSDQGTNGHVPAEIVRAIASPDELSRLLLVKLVESAGADYGVHDFLDWNPSAAEVAAKRAETSQIRSEAGKKGAAARWGGKDGNTDSSNDSKDRNSEMAPIPFPSPVPEPTPEQNPIHTRARDEAAPTQPPGASLQDLWLRITGNIEPNLLDVRLRCEDAARAQNPPIAYLAYAERAIRVFVEWAESCPPGRRPQIAPHKFVEHFGRVQRILAGKDSARHVVDPPADRSRDPKRGMLPQVKLPDWSKGKKNDGES